MRFVQATSGKFRVDGRGILIAASVMALSGCVSANGDIAKSKTAPATTETGSAETAAATPAAGTKPTHSGAYRDPALVSAANPYGVSVPRQKMPATADAANIGNVGNVVMQPTGINAGKSSIFSSQTSPAAASQATSTPAYVQTPGVNAAFSSVYSAPAQAAGPEPVIVPAKVPVTKDILEKSPVPDHSAKADQEKAAIVTPAQAATPEQQTASTEQKPAVPGPTDSEQVPDGKPLTLAAFFAAGSKKNPKGLRGDDDDVKPKSPTTKPVETASIAASAISNLKGPVTSMSDEYDDETDDGPTGLMKLVSLPSLTGLTRLAPNGLLVQTEHVNTNCFQAPLVNKIKSIEAHYGKPAIVTSGFREVAQNRRVGGASGSMHTSCQAADIQVEGVSKRDLASYLRSLPDRGGVGTYCHTESVHIDTGEARDWNWRCRRMASKR